MVCGVLYHSQFKFECFNYCSSDREIHIINKIHISTHRMTHKHVMLTIPSFTALSSICSDKVAQCLHYDFSLFGFLRSHNRYYHIRTHLFPASAPNPFRSQSLTMRRVRSLARLPLSNIVSHCVHSHLRQHKRHRHRQLALMTAANAIVKSTMPIRSRFQIAAFATE